MSLEVLIAAETHRLTTLEAVLAEINLGDNLVFAESLIDQSSAAIARYIGMPLAQQKYRQRTCVNRAHPWVVLQRAPLVRMDLMSLQEADITDPALHAFRVEDVDVPLVSFRYGYGWNGHWGTSPAWWGWSGPSWYEPEMLSEFCAGYVLPEQYNPPEPNGPLLPDDLQRGCIENCKIWFSERLVSERILSRSLGDQSIRYDLQSGQRALPMLTREICAPYRRQRVA